MIRVVICSNSTKKLAFEFIKKNNLTKLENNLYTCLYEILKKDRKS